MSVYRTIDSDYNVVQLNKDTGDIIGEYSNDQLNDEVSKLLCKSFNDAKLEQYLEGDLKDKVITIRMGKTRRQDNKGRPYYRITTTIVPGKRLTQKVKDTIDDYLSAQFCDGWGEGFFYPNHFTLSNGDVIAFN